LLFSLYFFFNKDIYGNAAIHYATDKRRKVIVELLLKFGANINLSDHRGITALHLACSNDDIEV
jgi:ankyrin repeat protein